MCFDAFPAGSTMCGVLTSRVFLKDEASSSVREKQFCSFASHVLKRWFCKRYVSNTCTYRLICPKKQAYFLELLPRSLTLFIAHFRIAEYIKHY